MARPITFTTPDGITLAGMLREPDDVTRRAAIVLTGPFTGVKEQVVAIYAEGLARRGYVTLAFDHRNFGASGGHPRQHEDSAGKLADLSAAVTCVAAHADVDPERVGLIGICLGAGYALKSAAFDPRVRALVTVAGAYNSPQAMRAGMGLDAYRDTLRELTVKEQATSDGQPMMLPAVRDGAGEAAMPGAEPFDYYGTDRGAVPGWRNEVTYGSIRQLLTFDAAVGADFLAVTPARIIHGTRDEYCSPTAAQEVFDRIDGVRDLMWIDTTNHIDLYDRPRYVEPAIEACADWFDDHLVQATTAH
ncbi:alpha/beta hydrolase [Rhodococcus spelaei]|uniref:Alpha/beta hydrolase n=1 Tax=Rhodococcus spelaei TaxID=2546320 RepID=A0A541BMW1_9NOCA|nr:alpha/beta hydrolase [Rhodococcus spelaei]